MSLSGSPYLEPVTRAKTTKLRAIVGNVLKVAVSKGAIEKLLHQFSTAPDGLDGHIRKTIVVSVWADILENTLMFTTE